SAARSAFACTGRRTGTCAATRPSRPLPASNWPSSKKAEAAELVLLSQDEARFPMVPTLTATLGLKGRRPEVGTWDNKGLLYVLAVVNLVTAAVHANTLEGPGDAKRKTGKSKKPRRTEAVPAPPRHARPGDPQA